MSIQGKDKANNISPETGENRELDVVVASNSKISNNLRSTEALNYKEHIVYLDKNNEERPASKESSSAYDDLDDYIFSHKRKVQKKEQLKSTKSEDKSLDKYMDSMYTDSKSTNKTSKSKRKKKKKKLLLKVLISILCFILALVIVAIVTISVLENKGEKSLLENSNVVDIDVPDDAQLFENGKFIVDKDGVRHQFNENITTILCMGVDKESFQDEDSAGDSGSADALFLIALDTSNGKTKVVNISRDIMTDVAMYSSAGSYIGTKKMQACLAYSYGDGRDTSCRNQVQTISNLFYNISINSYLSLDLDGIGAINDAVGGVTVTSPETIGIFVEGNTYTLRGMEAERFVRDRSHKTVDANTYRMARQKLYLEQFANILMSRTKEDIKTPLNLFNSAKPYTCTNLDASKITYLALKAIRGEYESGNIEFLSIKGKAKQGEKFAEFYIDEDEFFNTFLDVFYKPTN